MPWKSAAVLVKKPTTSISKTPEKQEEVPSSAHPSKGRPISTSQESSTQAKSSDPAQQKSKPTEDAAKQATMGLTKSNEKSELSSEAQQAVDAKKKAGDCPSLAFANKGKQKDAKLPSDREPAVAVAPNPFAALGGNTNEIGSGAGLPRKPSVAELAPTGRPRLNLAPRTLPLPGQSAEGEGAEKKGDRSPPKAVMSNKDVRQRVINWVIEFFHVRSLDKKLAKGTVSQPVFLKGFAPVIRQLDDIAVNVRYAYEFCGKLLKACGLSEVDVKQMAQKIEPEELETVAKQLTDSFQAAKLY
ncbi:hypothetical protein PCASD_22346 [Puccinia coronata f. sp. avenae]|uniref:Uncharacterized protein n=1 Tax=Puccinia coronata f. sp. avenae TaxID=200324 RepID=A0A2N5U8E6_9BASI|nr:hypothetical protein PCASD_22346 [Puccinia coronata f. sp. avenae]